MLTYQLERRDSMSFKVNDEVIFTSYNDRAWREYAGKMATVKDVYIYDDEDQELSIEFEDGQVLGVSPSECIPYRVDDK